jgi:TolB protein
VLAYVVCRPVSGGCVLQPWRELWAALAERRFRGPFAISMRGLMRDEVSARSEPISLALAEEEVDGALYFWSTDPPSIRRYDFGLARRSSELYLSQTAEGTCVGCHAISRDGSRIAVGVYDAISGFRSRVYDVATRSPILAAELDAPLPSYGASDDILLSGSPLPADGVDRPLRIVDGSDGSVLHDFGVEGVSADWSPDGDRVVFEGLSGALRELFVIEREDGAWLPPAVLVTPETTDEGAPSFAPDSEWIGFTARREGSPVVAAMQVSDGHTAFLSRAGAGLDATWLRWNPNAYRERGRTLFWLTFSSGRGYGVFDDGPRQIWMAAFDPEADPDDPSRPAFRFPAQRAAADNFIAEWTLMLHRQPCETDDECPDGELCDDGFCFPEGPE